MPSVLVSGASIAGPTLAYWLARGGYDVTLVERAPGLRPGGHAIDVRGVALDVLHAMGSLEAARRLRTQMKGVSRLNADGVEVWRSEEMTITGGSFDNPDIEILRDDLSGLLYDQLPLSTEALFDDAITDLSDTPDGVKVWFRRSPPRTFDLVIGADGMRSAVREIAFGPEAQFLRPMGVAVAIFSLPNRIGLKDWQLDYQGEHGNCLLYTARENRELRAGLGFAANPEDVPRDLEGQLALVREKCGHLGWEVPNFLAAMPTSPDFYVGIMAQVKMPAWSRGRVALVGDAAYCPSPYSGQGTSLAIVGAYVLAQTLTKTADHVEAFSHYEAKMRPFVSRNQAIADMSRDERFSDPAYYATIQSALDLAKMDIELSFD